MSDRFVVQHVRLSRCTIQSTCLPFPSRFRRQRERSRYVFPAYRRQTINPNYDRSLIKLHDACREPCALWVYERLTLFDASYDSFAPSSGRFAFLTKSSDVRLRNFACKMVRARSSFPEACADNRAHTQHVARRDFCSGSTRTERKLHNRQTVRVEQYDHISLHDTFGFETTGGYRISDSHAYASVRSSVRAHARIIVL